jgi:hypothetical protein
MAGTNTTLRTTDMEVMAAGTTVIKSGQDVVIQAADNASLRGNSADVEADTSANLRGAGSVSVTSNGPVTIKGSVVNVN